MKASFKRFLKGLLLLSVLLYAALPTIGRTTKPIKPLPNEAFTAITLETISSLGVSSPLPSVSKSPSTKTRVMASVFPEFLDRTLISYYPIQPDPPFFWPVSGKSYISQYFNRGHLGLDIAARYRNSVYAVKAGIVVFAGWKRNGGGFQVWLYNGKNMYTTYNHMAKVLVVLQQAVLRGQRVGKIGQTGNATGVHLHLQVWEGFPYTGKVKNPLDYLEE